MEKTPLWKKERCGGEERMRILHIENSSGIPFLLSRSQRLLGHEAEVLETWRLPIAYLHDMENYYSGDAADIFRLARTVNIGRRYDLIHLHTGMPRRRLDVVTLRALFGKTLVVHYHGSESRKGYGMHYQSIIDGKIVSTPDLLAIHPSAHYVANPVPMMEPTQPRLKTIKFLHMPTNRVIKGTSSLIQELEGLKKEFDFELRLVEWVPHEEAMNEIRNCDVLVDEVADPKITGVRGRLNVLTLEAMMLGRPVITNIDHDLMKYYEGCPVLSVSTEGPTLVDRLRQCLQDPDELRDRGLDGHRYVAMNHDPICQSQKILDIYASISRGGRRPRA
jgi:hypothetical protein